MASPGPGRRYTGNMDHSSYRDRRRDTHDRQASQKPWGRGRSDYNNNPSPNNHRHPQLRGRNRTPPPIRDHESPSVSPPPRRRRSPSSSLSRSPSRGRNRSRRYHRSPSRRRGRRRRSTSSDSYRSRRRHHRRRRRSPSYSRSRSHRRRRRRHYRRSTSSPHRRHRHRRRRRPRPPSSPSDRRRLGPSPPRSPHQPRIKRISSSSSSSSSAHDDTVGHFHPSPGTVLQDRYRLLRELGTGTFGKVFECADLQHKRNVAIKIVRAVKRYRESALIEAGILREVNGRADGRGRDLCGILWDTFDMRVQGHYCLVLECLGKSLYDYLKGREYAPFPLYCVRDFARQLLDAVDFMHGFGLIHTDLKPENILLLNDEEVPWVGCRDGGKGRMVPKSTRIKVIDFGGATYDNEKKSSVVNTRQYRAPEVILNLGWSTPSDLWSAGCIISELYTGELLFATHDNAEHLALMECALGPFPKDMLNHSSISRDFFDSDGRHRRGEILSASNMNHVRNMLYIKDMVKKEDRRCGLIRLLTSLLTIDPVLRSTAKDGLNSRFCRGDT